jgi:hypothetical protein
MIQIHHCGRGVAQRRYTRKAIAEFDLLQRSAMNTTSGIAHELDLPSPIPSRSRALPGTTPIAVRSRAFSHSQDPEETSLHRSMGSRSETICDPWHYVSVLARKLGALRNGAPFKDWVLHGGLIASPVMNNSRTYQIFQAPEYQISRNFIRGRAIVRHGRQALQACICACRQHGFSLSGRSTILRTTCHGLLHLV